MAQVQFGSIIKTVSATGTPEALGTGAIRCHSITFLGMKAARTNNAGKIWVSPGSGNDTAAVPVEPGESTTFTAKDADDYFTNAQFYIDVETAGDGVIAIYDK
tara:strand:- start:427 stop:735 length:309 start_codon:yes stop_codon:yes gene_type:complete